MNSVVIKIQPDFVEQFYKDLRPMIHYVPASLSNLTETMAYVLDSRNEHEMKGIVASANAWCRSAMTRWAFSNEATVAVEMYQHALDVFDVTWRKDWSNARLLDRIDDLVECNA